MQQTSAGQPPVQAEGGQGVPAVAPLPGTGSRAGTSGAQRTQPGAPARPTPPAARPPAAQQGQARTAQPANRPAADVAQEVQFDRDGLVTMHTNELDVRQLLELLSRRSGMNILVSPKVTGTITANFEGVTVEKVLDAVIKLANLTDRQEGSIHYIYTKEELIDEADFTRKERILTKVYKLSYVRADEILGVIRPFLSRDVGQKRISVTPSYRFGISESATFVSGGGQGMSATGGGGGAAAAGGTGGPGGAPPTGGGPTIGGFQPPTGGNSIADHDHLIIQDYESNLRIIDQIIERIDVRPIQVLIEAVIISVDYEHDRELGVNLGLVDGLGQTLGTVGTGTAINGNVGFTPTKLLTASGKLAQGPVTDAQGFTSPSNGVKFGFVASNVTGFIRALETIGSTKILASPRILVLNKQRAEIQLGSRLGFQTLSQNFTSTIQQVQFLNTGTLLRLRPFVSDDGMVRMEIHPERSSGSVTNNIPNQQTAELTTNVMVPDGSTLVIGGLIEDEDDFSYQGLPLLSRIPALGFLTGARQKLEGRRELVVLLTPHIWSVEQAMAHATAGPPPMGAFNASGPAGHGPTTFELETGAPPAATAAPGPVTALGNGPAGPMTADPRTGAPTVVNSGQPALAASSAGAALAGGMPLAAADPNGKPSEAPQRRRWPSLREWISRRSRGKDAGLSVRSDDPGSQAIMTPPGAIAQSPPGSVIMPPTGTAAALPGPPSEPTASPQQGAEAPPSAPNLDLGPPPAVGAVMNQRGPRRDAMLTRTVWTPDRLGAGETAPSRAASRGPAPTIASGNNGMGIGAVVAGPRRHTIAEGETLASIAGLYYGSSRYAEPLGQFNHGRIARGGLRPGDLLVLPPREELDSAGGWVVQPRSPITAGFGPSQPAEGSGYSRPRSDSSAADWVDPPSSRRVAARARQPRAITHVVGAHETPRSIARDRLGDARRAQEIIDLNHDLLVTEGRWTQGLRILLPPDAGPPLEGR